MSMNARILYRNLTVELHDGDGHSYALAKYFVDGVRVSHADFETILRMHDMGGGLEATIDETNVPIS